MTQKKQLTARVRARMAKTGESYTTALRHVEGASASSGPSSQHTALAPVVDHGYTLRGGQHPESANIAHVLAHYGITAAGQGGKGGQPISESLVFGIGGGPGAGYILWEFKAHGSAILTLGFQNQWQYTNRWMEKTLGRLGVRYLAEHTGGAAGAARRLTELLATGRPCIVRPDRYVIGYWGLPSLMDGCGSPNVVVYAMEGDRVHIDDRNVSPLTAPRATLDAARARVGSYKNSLYVIDPATEPISAETLRAAIQAGLEDCVDHLSASSESFSLPAWRKWARLLTDQKNAKAWPRVFAGRRALGGALLSIWEGALPAGGDGGHLRDLYADFLDQAAVLLNNPALREPAAAFRIAARAWQTVAATALPDDVSELLRLRGLAAAVRQSIVDPAAVTPEEAAQSSADLWALRAQLDRDFPLDDTAVSNFFATLSAALEDVYKQETAAVAHLAKVIGRP